MSCEWVELGLEPFSEPGSLPLVGQGCCGGGWWTVDGTHTPEATQTRLRPGARVQLGKGSWHSEADKHPVRGHPHGLTLPVL